MTNPVLAESRPIPALEQVLDTLSSHGYKITGPRRTIIEQALQQDRGFTAEQIVAQVPSIGRATVYRTLEILASLDLATRLLNPGGHPTYLVGSPGHRHHLVCTTCGRVVEFTHCPLDGLVADLTQDTGYQIEGHHLEIEGICPNCSS